MPEEKAEKTEEIGVEKALEMESIEDAFNEMEWAEVPNVPPDVITITDNYIILDDKKYILVPEEEYKALKGGADGFPPGGNLPNAEDENRPSEEASGEKGKI